MSTVCQTAELNPRPTEKMEDTTSSLADAPADETKRGRCELVEVNSMVDCIVIARESSSRENKRENPLPLLRFMEKNGHWSPFEFAHMALRITTSRGIAAQLLRHRSFSFQEFSQRYADPSKREFPMFQPVELRRQAKKNRQSSAGLVGDPELDAEVAAHLESSQRLYLKLIERGVARECARFVLPLAATTVIHMVGSVRSWIHYIRLRSAPDTQKEHRAIALDAHRQLIKRFPLLAGLVLEDEAVA